MKTLLQKLPDDIFTLKTAYQLGISRYYISKLLKNGKILKLDSGVFQKASQKPHNHQETSFKIATAKLKEQSAICLWSALSYYNLTEEVPCEIWCILPYPYDSQSVKALRLTHPQWEVGIIHRQGFSITNIERTIVDAFTHTRHIPIKEAYDAMKEALKTKKTNASKILKMAKKLQAEKKILPFLEIYL